VLRQAIEKSRSAIKTIVRWLRNPYLRRYELGFSQRYWKWRATAQLRSLSLCRLRFGLAERRLSRRQSASVFRELLWLVLPELMLAFLAIGLLALVEWAFFVHAPSCSQWLTGSPTWANRIRELEKLRPGPDTFSAMGGNVAQIAVLFLSLYFAAISVVASTVYAQAANEVRQLFIRERAGDFYIHMLSRCACVSLLAFGAGQLGIPLGFLNLALLGFLALFAVLSFGVLGYRALRFFDPAQLTVYLDRELAKWIVAATPKGYRWLDPSFQAHYQRRTERALRTYRDILSLAENRQPSQLAELLCRALLFLPAYVETKLRIPSESRWFRQRQRHRSWLIASSAETDVSLKADVVLQPEPVPDAMWFERDFEQIVIDSTAALLRSGEVKLAFTVAYELQRTLHTLGRRLAITEALQLQRSFGRIVSEHLAGLDPGSIEGSANDERYNLALLDCSAHGVVQILLGLSDRLSGVSAEWFGKVIEDMRWWRPDAIYSWGLPRTVVKRLEFTRDRLLLERDVERRRCSPSWYLQQLAASAFVEFLRDSVRDIMTEVEVCFVTGLDSLADTNASARLASLIEVGLEACNKCKVHFEQMRTWHESICRFRRVPEIAWPEIDWGQLDKRVDTCRKRLLETYAKLAPALVSLPTSDEWPDFFGHAYTVLAQEAYEAMASGDEVLVRKLYPSFFAACFAAPGRITPLLEGQPDRIRMVYWSESFVDLMCLSGVAMIYSELDGKSHWRVAKGTWDSHLGKLPKAKEFLKGLFGAIDYRDSLPGLTPRCTLRTSWKLDIHRRLSERGLTGWVQPPVLLGGRRPSPRHSSELINRITQSELPSVDDPEDIFIAMYLSTRPEAAGLQLPRHAQRFADSMARLRKRPAPEDQTEE